MRRRPYRACLGLLLIFTLLSMMGERAAMAMPMVDMTHHTHSHHTDRQMMADAPLQYVTSNPSHQGQCGCYVHCFFCSICHATMSSGTVSKLSGTFGIPIGPRLPNLTELSLPLDPHPPRA